MSVVGSGEESECNVRGGENENSNNFIHKVIIISIENARVEIEIYVQDSCRHFRVKFSVSTFAL